MNEAGAHIHDWTSCPVPRHGQFCPKCTGRQECQKCWNAMKLDEIAERIHAHLKRFESDPVINKKESHRGMKLSPYWMAGACRSGSFVSVCYISFQGRSSLRRAEALEYLAWLNAGNVGHHHAMKIEKMKGKNVKA